MRHYRISDSRVLAALTALIALIAFPLAGASAQRKAAEPTPRVMIPIFMSAEKDLGVQAAEALRSRVTRDADVKKLVVIPKADINNTLNASGYSTTEPLQPNDAKALATLLRADEYMDGVVTKTPTGVKIDARLILARDQNLSQALPSAEGAKVDQAAAAVSKSYQAAREQLAPEKNCYMLFREGKHNEAIMMGRSALSKYPNGTIAMVCLANAYQEMKQPDSVLAIAERITAIDPRNIPGNRFKADIYRSRGNTDKATAALIALMAADPSNEKLRDDVIADLVRSGQVKRAIPLVEEALRTNPGDPKTLGLAWRVYLADQTTFEKALTVGAEMVKADTALADSSYYVRSTAAASSVNPARAAQILAEGIKKFPNNAGLLVVQANSLSKAGQNAQALAAINNALAKNPKVENGYAQKFLILTALNQSDSAIAALRVGAANGSDKHTLSQFALKAGSDAYKAGNVSKKREDLAKAIQFLQLSDQLEPSSNAKFLTGASAFLMGQSAVTEAQETKKCDLARLAKASFATAQENVPAGLTDFPDAAKQLLTAIPQFTPAVDDQVRRFCK